MLDSVETGLWYAHADMNTGVKTQTVFGSLDAFMPAMLVLGNDLETAEKLQESCYKMWNHFGIEPEEINYKTFEVTAPYYILRPENIESAFYLYRKTKNPKYLEMGKTFFDSIEAVSYTHLRAHETVLDLVCRLLLEKKKENVINNAQYIKSNQRDVRTIVHYML